MNFPDKLPVSRMQDYHTHFIGRYNKDKQFWAYETFVFTKLPLSEGESWEKHRREYAVLYLFDQDGNLVEAKHKYAGTTDSPQIAISEEIAKMVSELDGVEFCDIDIKPFEIEIDGFKFGLIPDEESQMIELQPSSTIAFSEPWDGEYYT